MVAKRTQLWLTSKGEYSSYAVDCVFSTETAALEWVSEQKLIEKLAHDKRERIHAQGGHRPSGPMPYFSDWNAPMEIDLDPPLPSTIRRVK